MPVLIPSQQRQVDAGEAVQITVLAGQMFRGTLHFQEQDYLVSPEWAAMLVKDSIARLKP